MCGDIVVTAVGCIRKTDRRADGVFFVLAEGDSDVFHFFDHTRHICSGKTICHIENRRGTAPTLRNIDRDVFDREIPQIIESQQRSLNIEVGRAYRTQPARKLNGDIFNAGV